MDTLDTLRAMLIEQFQLKPEALTPDTLLRELGVDSLALLEFSFEMEQRFNVDLPQNVALSGATLGELAAALDKAAVSKAAIEVPAENANEVFATLNGGTQKHE
jgi:acyl carrier protein